MGLQFPSCTTFELIEVFIPDQLHHGAYCQGNYGAKNGCAAVAAAAEAGQLEGGGGGVAEARRANIITRVDEI